jgi:ribonucleoside-diphosphate reductase alpha chain
MSAARSSLPRRREHEVFEFEHDCLHYTAGIGRYGYGPIGEVFLDVSKAGTAIQTYARDSAIILSLLLQHGCPIETVRHALTRNPDGKAAGPIGALLDLLAGPLGDRLRKPEPPREMTPP